LSKNNYDQKNVSLHYYVIKKKISWKCHVEINSRPNFLLSNKKLVENKDHALYPMFLLLSSFTLDFNKIHNEGIYVKNLQDSINASIEKLYYLQI
jgi:hypothetical protein